MIRLSGLALALLATPALGATAVLTGPPPRAVTDPKTIVSHANPDARPVPVADLYAVRSASSAAWTPDGRTIVFSTNITGRFNLWKVSAEGGFPVQLTQSDDRQGGIAVSPDGKTVVFESDYGGAEIDDLFAVPLGGGAVVNLTSTQDVSESGARFSPDGKSLTFSRRLKAGSTVDIALMDLATRKVRLLTNEKSSGFFWYAVGFTQGGKVLIADRSNIDGTVVSVWRIDVTSGKAKALTDPSPKAFNQASGVSADGSRIALTIETKDGARQAALLDTAARKTTLVKPDAWEQQGADLSPDGRTMLFTSNVDGEFDLFAATDGVVRRIELPQGSNQAGFGVNAAFAPGGRRVLAAHEASNTPSDLWTVDLSTGKATQITTLGLASVSPAILPGAQVVHYKSEDGTVISALLWVPFNLKRDGSAPGIVYPHGGPTGQTPDYFSRLALALASRGYVVIAPNPRGSTGYGRAFQEANRKDLGGGDLVDEVYGARFLIATGLVSPKKLGITGGSYGGYMTLMAIGKTPQLWAAAVDMYGIINWFTMYTNGSPSLQQYQIDLLGDPVKDKDVYVASSPMTYIKNARAPLLVLQGENDIRVPKEESEQVVSVLKAQGVTVDSHFYPGEGHGFAKRENQIDSIERMVAWFDRYLKGS